MGCQADERAIELIASPRPKRVGQSRPTVAVEPSVFDCAGDGRRRAVVPWRRSNCVVAVSALGRDVPFDRLVGLVASMVRSRFRSCSNGSPTSGCRRTPVARLDSAPGARASPDRLAAVPSVSSGYRSARATTRRREMIYVRAPASGGPAITTYGTQASRICLIVEGPAP